LIKGIRIENTSGNKPFFQKAESFFTLVIPISNKNTAKNPLNKYVVNGAIPAACFSLAKKPMI
jgi:hypothetical protein